MREWLPRRCVPSTDWLRIGSAGWTTMPSTRPLPLVRRQASAWMTLRPVSAAAVGVGGASAGAAAAGRRPTAPVSPSTRVGSKSKLATSRSVSAVSRISRIGSSSTLRSSLWKPELIFLNSP